MIFRKPYAFFIKNFRRIHIVILFLCIFVYLKLNNIFSFIQDYINFGVYSSGLEPFSSKTGFFFYLSLLVIIIASGLLIILLRRKEKPWKIYLLYIGEYLFLLSGVILVSRYFSSYSVETSVSGVLIYRDMLRICKYLQYPIFILLLIRILGIDLKKFNFSKDEEFLELSNEDQEEFEVSFEFDRESIRRAFRRLRRNLNYFYREHQFFVRIFVVGCVLLIAGYSYYYFGIVHKSYKQGEAFHTGLYQITIEDSYITNKDFAGNIIEDKNNFVVMVMKIKNLSDDTLEPNLSRFHLMNRSSDKTYTMYYNTYFTDIGQPVEAKMQLRSNQEKEFYLVFKVSDELNPKQFVLYYQELGGKIGNYLRKIKLTLRDLSNIKEVGTYSKGDSITFQYVSEKKKIQVTDIEFSQSFPYLRYYCTSDVTCSVHTENLVAKDGKTILKVSFASSDFEGEDFIDFSTSYGRIKYIDNSGETKYADISDAIGMEYQGKEVYLSVDSEIVQSQEIFIIYTLRDKRYSLKIK